MTVQVDEVQTVPDGFGFHLKAGEYTWITVVFETKREAEEPPQPCLKKPSLTRRLLRL